MSVLTLTRELSRLRTAFRQQNQMDGTILDMIRQDPSRILNLAGKYPDPWQMDLTRHCSDRTLILASRQVGKSLVAGALALREALLHPGALVLLVSPSLRQSAELFNAKVMQLYSALGRPLAAESESAIRLELSNGSRIISLPASEATIRGFAAVSLLILDEAARIPDALYYSVRPMLAVSQGKLICLSTAYGRQGFFFTEWNEGGNDWQRVKVMATECNRISPAFLGEERTKLGPRLFSREYECEFSSADDAVFDFDSVRAAMTVGGEAPLF